MICGAIKRHGGQDGFTTCLPRDSAKRIAENLLQWYGDDVTGVFASNEPATTGMLLALPDIYEAGKNHVYSFGSSPQFVEVMKNNQMQGIVIQNPFAIGELRVKKR